MTLSNNASDTNLTDSVNPGIKGSTHRIGGNVNSAALTYIVAEPYTDRDRLYTQYELLREDFNEWFSRALRLGDLSTEPEKAEWRALDVGCGEGLFAGEIGVRYPRARVVGFDKDEGAIATANTVFGRKDGHRLHFYVHDVVDPLTTDFNPAGEEGLAAEGSFDIAFAHLLLMHLRDPAQALAHIAAAIKPGGVVYLRDTPLEAIPFPHPSMTRLMDVAGDALRRIATPDLGYRHEEYLGGAGFEEIESGRSAYVVGGPTEEGQRMFNNLISGLKSARPGLVGALRLIGGEEFDEHMYRLATEVTTDMVAHWEIVNTIARKPPGRVIGNQ